MREKRLNTFFNQTPRWGICTMTSFDYNYQNALRHAIVFSIFFPFVKNHSRVTQMWITKIAAKCILVVVVKWRQMSYFQTKTNLTHSKSSCWQTWPAIMESRTSRAWTSIVSSASRVWCWWGASAEVTSWESLWRTETSSSRLFCNASFCLLFWKQRSTSRLNMTWDWWLKNKQTNKQEILWGFASWLLPSE